MSFIRRATARGIFARAAKIIAASLLVATAPAFAHGPDVLKGVGFDQHPGAQLPRDLALQDETGRQVTLGQALGGKPAVLVLGYLQCKDLCPTTIAGVTHALDGSGLDAGMYRALFVSIDPRESVSMLGQEKAERIAPRDRGAWRFLRADGAAVAKLSHAVGFRYRYEPARDAFAHAAGFAVVTPRGEVSRYFLGVSYDPKQLGQALRDADRQEVAPPASPLLLLCYHFDPLTGRYTFTILRVLRVAIGLFFVAVALVAWRRHRRSRIEARS